MTRRQDRITPTVQEGGTIRRLWRNLAGYNNASGSADFNWTLNEFENLPDTPRSVVTTPLRYLITTVNTLTAGNLLSNPMARSPVVRQRQAPAPPLAWSGNMQHRPVLRNRITSFGSRVPPENSPSRDGVEL
jgi:hypothetical protein